MIKMKLKIKLFFGKIADYFEFSKHKTNFRIEILAGVSTFLALSYIFVVNPAILAEAGMNKSAVLFATIVASGLATLAMGIWAKKPLVLAPGMEMNAYVAFFVVLGLGFTWQEALGAVFWSGVIFFILTITRFRENIINAIPDKMKSGLALSVGIFLMLIALKLAGILVYEGVTLKKTGLLFSSVAYIFYFGLAVGLILRKMKIQGSLLISILLASVFAHIIGVGHSTATVEVSEEMLSALFKMDISVILKPRIFSVILVLFLIDFYGSIAKLIGLTRNTSIVDKDGNLPDMKKAMIVDGTANSFGAALGTTSIITYVESRVGIAEGGRTGFTAVVSSLLMFMFILLTPFLNLVPLIATTGALFMVGITLFPSKEELKTYSKLEVISVIVMLISVIITFAIDKVLLFGFVTFIMGLLINKKYKEINLYMVLSTILLLMGWMLLVFIK